MTKKELIKKIEKARSSRVMEPSVLIKSIFMEFMDKFITNV